MNKQSALCKKPLLVKQIIVRLSKYDLKLLRIVGMIEKEVFSEGKKSKTIIACFERGTLSALQCWMCDVTLGGCVRV